MKPNSFNERAAAVKTPKSDINSIILDYLTMEGYPQAAAKFSREANLPLQHDHNSITVRRRIQTYIHRGEIEKAISDLNDLDPEILDKNDPLHFALLRLQLIELIRASNGSDVAPALVFASQQLGPRAPTNPQFLKDLEVTMALLFFPAADRPPAQKALMDPDLRREVAEQVNKAILRKNNQRRETAIRDLVKMRAWAENTTRENKNSLPDLIELGFHGIDQDGLDEHSHENGQDAMITT